MFNEEYFLLENQPPKPSSSFAGLRISAPKESSDAVALKALKEKLDAEKIFDEADIFTSYVEGGKQYYFLKSYEGLISFLKSKNFEEEEIKKITKSFKENKFYSNIASLKIFLFLYSELEKGNDINPYFRSLVSIIRTLNDPEILANDNCLAKFFQIPPKIELLVKGLKSELEKDNPENLVRNLEELDDNIKKIKVILEILKNLENLQTMFPEWNPFLQLLYSLDNAFKMLDKITNDLNIRLAKKDVVSKAQEKRIETEKIVSDTQKFKSSFVAFDLENILRIAQNDFENILNTSNVTINDKSVSLQEDCIRELEKIKLGDYPINSSIIMRLAEFRKLKKAIITFNKFARENNLKELPQIQFGRKSEKHFLELFKERLEYEKKKRDCFSLIQFISKKQVQSGVLRKIDESGEYEIIDRDKFEKLPPLTKNLISRYLIKEAEQNTKKIQEPKSEERQVEIKNKEIQQKAKKLPKYKNKNKRQRTGQKTERTQQDKSEKKVEKTKQRDEKEQQDKSKKATDITEIGTFVRTLVKDTVKTGDITRIKQNATVILSYLNKAQVIHTEAFQAVKSSILNIATVKNLEDETGKIYSSAETLLIAKNDPWKLKNINRRNLYLSKQIACMPISKWSRSH